jgi:hypothetical protein
MIGSSSWLQRQSVRGVLYYYFSRRGGIFQSRLCSVDKRRNFVTTSAPSSLASSDIAIHSTNHCYELKNVYHTNNFLYSHQQLHQQRYYCKQQYRRYGSKFKVELDRNAGEIIATASIEPYLRTCLRSAFIEDEHNHGNSGNGDSYDKIKTIDMEFAITFLGTGGGTPTAHRNGSCTALRLGGQTFLFDVCEGTSRQLQFTRIAPLSITKIFISHLHGDHLYGIVPVIMSIMIAHKAALNASKKEREQQQQRMRNNNNKQRQQQIGTISAVGEDSIRWVLPTLEIYGPPGLYNYICMVLSLSCSKMNYLNVKVIELVGGKEERGPPAAAGGGGGQRGKRNVFTSHYPEIQTPLVTRKFLEQVSCNKGDDFDDSSIL